MQWERSRPEEMVMKLQQADLLGSEGTSRTPCALSRQGVSPKLLKLTLKAPKRSATTVTPATEERDYARSRKD
jgi:hypothetical protein